MNVEHSNDDTLVIAFDREDCKEIVRLYNTRMPPKSQAVLAEEILYNTCVAFLGTPSP